MKQLKVIQAIVITCLVGAWVPWSAQAIDLAPLDGVAPPPGARGASIALGYREFNEVYLAGVRQPQDFSIRVRSAALRYGQSVSFGQLPGYIYADLPLLEVNDEQGVGDIALAAAIWPYANRTTGTYVGIAGYLVLPTGSYDVQKTQPVNLNPGGNRTVGALQTGVNQRLFERFNLQTAIDVAVFEDNDQYLGMAGRVGTLEQRALVSWQGSLSYRFSPATAIGLSYFNNAGGEVRSHGGAWSGEVQNERIGLWARTAISPRMTAAINYKRAINIENGIKESDNIQLRVSRFF